MAEKRIPLHLVTVWHPERWLGLSRTEDLKLLPYLLRKKETLDELRKKVAKQRGLDIWYADFHGRRVSNLGEPIYKYRKTWLPADNLFPVLQDFDLRLISTIGEYPQAQWKFECRPNWGAESNALPSNRVQDFLCSIRGAKKISIRQVWKNPVAARFGDLPLEVSPDVAPETANLVVAPFDETESLRRAKLSFRQIDEVWWLVYD